jgi:hypothetical protein
MCSIRVLVLIEYTYIVVVIVGVWGTLSIESYAYAANASLMDSHHLLSP